MDAGWIDVGMLVATFLLALLAGTTATAAYLTYRVNIDPHVIVYSKHDDERPSLFLLVVENIGKGVAYDVRFSLEAPIPQYAPGIAARAERSGSSKP